MKNRFITLSIIVLGLALLGSCTHEKAIPYVVLNKYFVKNDVDITQLKNPVIDSKDQFNTLFGTATVMGTDGKPTPVDFDKQFVIAVVKDQTNKETELTPISLTQKDQLTFKYNIHEGLEQSFSSRPILLIAVDKEFKAVTKVVESEVK